MKRSTIVIPIIAFVLVLLAVALPAAAQMGADKISIPYKKFVLDNGLTLIVHEDHKAPIVAVNVWYHVGSKNEKQGKTGFAHLFEHLMFNGTENYNDDYFKPMQKIGATDMNGTTNEDRTNYFENVPTSAVDIALWMESDRMGHLKGAISQARLDEQRGVVQNEKRQGDNEPYGVTDELITKATFMPGHPYSWTVIGSLDDLDAAKLEDVQEWFKTYYGPNNAVLSIAGDIDPQTAFEKVKKYFGDIPPGPPISKYDSWVAKRTGAQRQIVQDRVSQARLYKVWNMPQWGTADADYLDLFSDVLTAGKTSRLYKRLVYDEQIATSVFASVDLREIAGLFTIQVDIKQGEDLAKVEKAVDEELSKLLAQGPTEKELQRVKTQYMAGFIRGSERIGGFGGKSDILARNEVFGGSPDYYKTTLKHMSEATVKDLQDAGNRWLSDGVYVLEVYPYPKLSAANTGADRSKIPDAGAPPEVKFPEIQKSKLSNGLNIVLAERHAVPLVRFALLLDAGSASDQFGVPGTASLAMDLLDEGTTKRTSLQFNEELNLLGAQLGSGSSLDISTVTLSTLKENLEPTLNIFSDVILNPAFPEDDFKRLQKMQIAQIKREKTSPQQMAFRVLPKILYGSGHAYSNPLTGSGSEESVAKLTRKEMVEFHKIWFKPDHATLVVVGDITMKEAKPILEKLFKDWKGGSVPSKNIRAVEMSKKPAIYVMDKPGAPQSFIFAGHLAPPSSDPDAVAIETMNFILGGNFVSRINMNLREDKHWSYGARSLFVGARGQRPFLAFAPVQTDKTKESMIEMKKELDGIVGAKPITNDEYNNARNGIALQLPGRWETMGAVEGSLQEMVRYGYPDDYFKTYPERIRSLKLEDLTGAAQKAIHPNNVQWVVVGDMSKILPGIKELGYGDIKMLDADGNVTEGK